MSINVARGTGRAILRASGSEAIFSELSYTYPLKLLSPTSHAEHVAIAYILSYGGGLVGGDSVNLAVDVGPDTRLLLLTQGTTKIFKSRKEARSSAPNDISGSTRQTLGVVVSHSGLVVLLPDPVTCFRSASYEQRQTFRLQKGASAVILDSLTSGRLSRGEHWDFSRYFSVNEIWVDDVRVARDALVLEEDLNIVGRSAVPRSLKQRLAPYACYATLFLLGPLVQPTITSLLDDYKKISQMRRMSAPELIWSLSPLEDGLVVRVAGEEPETVQRWFRDNLQSLRDVVGGDAYEKAFV